MRRTLVVIAAVAMTVTACTAEAPGQPVPGTGVVSTPTPTSESRTGEAPPINAPELDLASYESRVCDLLTPTQVAPFAIRAPGEPRDGPAGPACTWNPPDTTAGVRISIAILSKANGWEGIYERRDKWVFFEEAEEINGYPAVHLEATSDGTKGLCVTVPGVRQDLAFQIGVDVYPRNSPGYRDACSVSDRVASLVIDTLKGGR